MKNLLLSSLLLLLAFFHAVTLYFPQLFHFFPNLLSESLAMTSFRPFPSPVSVVIFSFILSTARMLKCKFQFARRKEVFSKRTEVNSEKLEVVSWLGLLSGERVVGQLACRQVTFFQRDLADVGNSGSLFSYNVNIYMWCQILAGKAWSLTSSAVSWFPLIIKIIRLSEINGV